MSGGAAVSFAKTLAFALPAGADPGLLAARLEHHVGLETHAMPPGPSSGDGVAVRWISLCLLLAREVMQAGRMPVFDFIRLVSVKPHAAQPGRFSAAIEVTRIDNLPQHAYDAAIKAAFAGCAGMAEPGRTEAEVEQLLVQLEKGAVRRLLNITRSAKSTIPVLRGAHALGIPFMHLGGGVYQLGWGAAAKRMERSSVAQDSAIGARLSQNKVNTAQLLRMAGLPGPEHVLVRTMAQARDAAKALGWPVVVKPTDRDRGEGVVVDITGDAALTAAFARAAAMSRGREAIVERQVPGVCHRLFIAEGKLLYAVKRLPMSVAGDGASTIEGLVKQALARQARKPPWSRSEIQPIDDEAQASMKAAGYTALSVPAPGALVPLRRIESTEAGGVDEDASALVHAEHRRIASKAAALFGLHTAGIDIITTDIARPWHETGAIINEVNFAPLFGGGDISRSHIPQFLQRFVGGDGRIPVDLFIGGPRAVEAAAARWKEQVAAGVRCFFSTPGQTIGPAGREWLMARDGLFARTQALALDAGVQAMVLVVQDDEFATAGLPLPFMRPATVIDETLVSFDDSTAPAPRERVEQVLRLLGAAKLSG